MILILSSLASNTLLASPDRIAAPNISNTNSQRVPDKVISQHLNKKFIVGHKLTKGSTVYADRNFTYWDIPSELEGSDYFITYNKDKFEKGNDIIRFKHPNNLTVYIAFDNRLKLPSWILKNSFVNTNKSVDIFIPDDKSYLKYNLYKKKLTAGEIILGGNLHENENFNGAMYLVIFNNNLSIAEPSMGASINKPGTFSDSIKTKEDMCKKYAEASVEQITYLHNLKACNYSELPNDYGSLHNMCMGNTQQRLFEVDPNTGQVYQFNNQKLDPEAVLKERQEKIAECVCTPYANHAVASSKYSDILSCNYSGSKWNVNFDYHYNWCASGGGDIVTSKGDWKKFKSEKDNAIQRCQSDHSNKLNIISNGVIKLNKNIFISTHNKNSSEVKDFNQDRDGLIDKYENELANQFVPYLIFDSDEEARKPHEPITLFQVKPKNNNTIFIKFALLFHKDHYGPEAGWGCSWGSGSHQGDIETMTFTLSSSGGLIWKLSRVEFWGDGPTYPETRMDFYQQTHPNIYLSASKHHQHLSTRGDHEGSPYSSPDITAKCDDDVNGKGDQFLANIRSFNPVYYFNNVLFIILIMFRISIVTFIILIM